MKHSEEIKEFNELYKTIEKSLFLSRFLKNKNILLNCLEEEHRAGKLLLTSILKNYHLKGKITLTQNVEENKQKLIEISKENNLVEEVLNIFELFNLYKKHKSSSIEFLRQGKIIILDENQNITLEKLKTFFDSIKKGKEFFNSL